MHAKYEVADVLDRLGANIEQLGLNTWQLRTLSAIRRCRTAALGGHIDACDGCGNISISYNSCRNRHSLGVPAQNIKVKSVSNG